MSAYSRIKELDLTKTFVLLVAMIGIHSFYDLTEGMGESVIGSVLNVLGGSFGAPIFMFCMGITLGFSHRQSPKDWLHRGFYLLTLGMAVNVLRWGSIAFRAWWTNEPELYKDLAQIFNVDIMQFAGLAFMLLALLQYFRLNHWAIILALGVVLNVVGSLLEGHYTDSYVLNQLLGCFYPTPTCCCFPLLNWFIFVAAGNTLGVLYKKTTDIGRFFLWMLPVSAVVTAAYLYLTIVVQLPVLRTLQGDWGLYWMNPYDALPTAFFIAPFMVGVFWLLGQLIPDSWMRFLAYPSQHINQVFCVSWVWIMWISNIFLFVPKATNECTFVLVWIGISALTLLTIYGYEKYLQARIAPWFSRHATAWTIAVWLFIIAFGAWYFTTIPGPYTVPY